jgi:hypothetical protein
MSPYDLAKSYGVEELTKLFEKYWYDRLIN